MLGAQQAKVRFQMVQAECVWHSEFCMLGQ